MKNKKNNAMTRTITNDSLLFYKDRIVFTTYENSKYQVFNTEEVHAVYDKEIGKVYELTLDGYTKLLLKIETIINYPK